MVFEEVARGSVTKITSYALIETFVQRGVALANKLHHPEAEDRAFRDTGRLTLNRCWSRISSTCRWKTVPVS